MENRRCCLNYRRVDKDYCHLFFHHSGEHYVRFRLRKDDRRLISYVSVISLCIFGKMLYSCPTVDLILSKLSSSFLFSARENCSTSSPLSALHRQFVYNFKKKFRIAVVDGTVYRRTLTRQFINENDTGSPQRTFHLVRPKLTCLRMPLGVSANKHVTH